MFAASLGLLTYVLRPCSEIGAGPQPLFATLPARSSRVTEDADRVLLERVANGDEHAYRELAQRYLAPILRYAARILGDAAEGEDVAQETFLRLWQQASRYESREAKPTTWLYRIAHNLCIDRLRRRRDVSSEHAADAPSADRTGARLDRQELVAELSRALAALPERQRAAIVLVHHEGMSQGEAAAVLDCRVDAVESLLARARRSLREQLAPLYALSKEDPP